MSLPIGTGFTSSPSSPDYVDLNTNEKVRERSKGIQQGPTTGAVLAKDSLNVPLEEALPIAYEQIGSGRPTLMPLFRTRYVEDKETTDLTQNFAMKLRNALDPEMRARLETDEKQLFDERDPDLIALDQGLIQFGAEVLTHVAVAGLPVTADDARLVAAQNYLNLPEVAKQEGVAYGSMIDQYLDRFLSNIGPNDPSYDLLLKASNQLKQTLQIVKNGF